MFFHMAAHICTVSDRRHIVAVSLLSVERNSSKEDTVTDISSYPLTDAAGSEVEPNSAH